MATARDLSLFSTLQRTLPRHISWTWPWQSTAGCLFLVGLWCAVLFFYGLNAGDLWRTEGLRARIAQEMWNSGNWLVPTLHGEPIFTKPPVMYWAVLLCSLPLGEVTPLSARLPSALAASATVLMFFFACRHYLGLRGALAGALMLPMSLMWLDKAPAAEIDMMQVCWIAAALLSFFRAVEREEDGQPAALWWYAATVFMGLGVLTKWTAPAFFYGTALTFLWWRGQLRLLWNVHHVLGLLLAVFMCLAWIGAVIFETSADAFVGTVAREGLSRLVPNYERPYRLGEALLHPPKLLLMTLPWSALALLTLRPGFGARLEPRRRLFLHAMHCWAWPNVLLCTYLAEHTPRHSFPLFTGLAGLAALSFVVWQEKRTMSAWLPWKPWQLLAATLVFWVSVKAVYVDISIPQRTEKRQTHAMAERLASYIPAGTMLYLFLFKDDGLLFYYNRPTLRLANATELPGDRPAYCLLTERDWRAWPLRERTVVVRFLRDQQGDWFLLVKVS